MCVICASFKGRRQPTEKELREMFKNNPHGAGYMFARDGQVHISKGYMDVESFIKAVKYEKFTDADAVVYHCRISTQAGVTPQMTHPFPLTSDIKKTKELELLCPCGIAHNGIIRLTTDYTDKEYSDTAHFIAEYLSYMLRHSKELRDKRLLTSIETLIQSKMAIMDGSGYIAIIGEFLDEGGLKFSNGSYRESVKHTKTFCKTSDEIYRYLTNYKQPCKSYATFDDYLSENYSEIDM